MRAMHMAWLRPSNKSTPSAAYPSAASRPQMSRMLSFSPKASWTTTTPGNGPTPSGRARYDLPRDSFLMIPVSPVDIPSAGLPARDPHAYQNPVRNDNGGEPWPRTQVQQPRCSSQGGSDHPDAPSFGRRPAATTGA